jgi:membrane-bound lytic murein transglycosylase A
MGVAETVLAAPRMIAQDTGSAIVGPARCDIFFGSGDDAGARAGDIQQGRGLRFLPRDEAPDS